MAFTSILRKSVNTLAPLAIWLTRVQRNYHSCIFTALNHSFQSQRPAANWFHSNSHYILTANKYKRKPPLEFFILILESEVRCAEESDENDQVEETSGEFPFEIKDSLYMSFAELTRKYGSELIEVTVFMPSEEDVVNNDVVYEKPEGFPKTPALPKQFPKKCDSTKFALLPLRVNVWKEGDPCLGFNVTAVPDNIVIDSVCVGNPDATYRVHFLDDYEVRFPFHDLNENLQKAFHKYLEIRGIKPIITNFMNEYMINKEHCRRVILKAMEESIEEERRLMRFRREEKKPLVKFTKKRTGRGR